MLKTALIIVYRNVYSRDYLKSSQSNIQSVFNDQRSLKCNRKSSKNLLDPIEAFR